VGQREIIFFIAPFIYERVNMVVIQLTRVKHQVHILIADKNTSPMGVGEAEFLMLGALGF
jgi:hypothetical protein